MRLGWAPIHTPQEETLDATAKVRNITRSKGLACDIKDFHSPGWYLCRREAVPMNTRSAPGWQGTQSPVTHQSMMRMQPIGLMINPHQWLSILSNHRETVKDRGKIESAHAVHMQGVRKNEFCKLRVSARSSCCHSSGHHAQTVKVSSAVNTCNGLTPCHLTHGQ